MSRYRSHVFPARRVAGVCLVVFLVLGMSAAAALYHARGTSFAQDSWSVQYSSSGTYAFPLSGDPSILSWTRLHWDGSNAVDLFAHHELSMDSPDFQAFKQRHIVAVTSGTVRRVDNERGGVAIMLHGDDGRVYYYSHLQRSFIELDAPQGRERVDIGRSLGIIGNTGRWSQYIEPHLHFSIASSISPVPAMEPDINAADWLLRHFGLIPEHWPDPSYPPASPSGPPFAGAFDVTRSFDDYRLGEAANPDIASVDLLARSSGGPGAGSPAEGRPGGPGAGSPADSAGATTNQLSPVPVLSPLLGEVRVHRTRSFGLRVQVTNRHTNETVVLSGLSNLHVHPGDIVEHGAKLGEVHGELNLMHFHNGQLSDPAAFF